MSNINKKYAILSSIIVILAVILVLTILLKNRGYSLPTLKAINSNISEIKINRGTNETLSIKLNEGKWILNEEYIVDSDIIESMTNALYLIKPVEIISRGEDDKEKYKLLDEELLTVIAIDNSSKELRNIKFGMKATLGNNVYAQIDKDKNIYLLGNLSSNPKDIFDKSEDDIINKTISSIRNDKINKITVSYNNKDYTLEKSESTNWLKVWNNSTVKVDDLYSPIYTIANFKADGLIRENLDKNLALYKIEIFADNDFVLYEILNKNNNYEVSLSNDNNRYYINDATFSNLKEAIDNIIK
ncbi:DUF4340 domain-containing protein [Brachyspira aalborgi]|uniref:DUF4340 domain-containing protein n=1 Tax=Brachyspira aalborgi TaxID=29522 RepID=A0AB38PZQ1_9SPIR|nr:DUF4340 domain-containing protein [Brachyspira aalborgi]TXJ15885.1 DUF4340 domain-containing protein [Brachyspira aalborgi]TXJ19385.1 DUF4340 domain-containing protein [Brachyspira aalborgi]TXJ26136.1 DUF4340 domain-containing protein [Brachyspira aalborgi]TXJ48687.1 DUF4340 domain-containing protein [Brachyspira aalborgi]